jgi:cell division protein FtsI/penicillin-binding protein 2
MPASRGKFNQNPSNGTRLKRMNSVWYKITIIIIIIIFKIISLQPTRKENNWETEEMMERATVTLVTERAKWPNPGCL